MTRTVVNPLASANTVGRRSDVRPAQLPALELLGPTACTRTTPATRSSPPKSSSAITGDCVSRPAEQLRGDDDRPVTGRAPSPTQTLNSDRSRGHAQVQRSRSASDSRRRSTSDVRPLRAVTFADALARLEAGLAAALPAPHAQARLAPVPRREWPAGFTPARPPRRRSPADFPRNDAQAHIMLTVRADTLGQHSGQVSLPGGVVDPGETFEQAALREAHEEVALRARRRARARRADAARHSGQRIPAAPDRRRPTGRPR